MPQYVQHGSRWYDCDQVGGQNVLPGIYQSREWQKVERAIRHHDQIVLVFEFRDFAKKSVVEPLPQSRVSLLLLESGAILRRFLLQQFSGWEAVPVDSVASHGE